MSTVTTPVRDSRAGVVLRAIAGSAMLGGIAMALLFAIGSATPAASAAAGVAGLALSAGLASAIALAIRAVLVAVDRRRHVGGRDRRHSESLERDAEPAHPSTPGRPRPRAPGAALPAA